MKAAPAWFDYRFIITVIGSAPEHSQYMLSDSSVYILNVDAFK